MKPIIVTPIYENKRFGMISSIVFLFTWLVSTVTNMFRTPTTCHPRAQGNEKESRKPCLLMDIEGNIDDSPALLPYHNFEPVQYPNYKEPPQLRINNPFHPNFNEDKYAAISELDAENRSKRLLEADPLQSPQYQLSITNPFHPNFQGDKGDGIRELGASANSNDLYCQTDFWNNPGLKHNPRFLGDPPPFCPHPPGYTNRYSRFYQPKISTLLV